MTGRNVDVDTSDPAGLEKTIRLYNDFRGVVLDEGEGQAICEALGPEGKGAILQNHGILSASTNVEATVAYFIRLEQLCDLQLRADAAGIPFKANENDEARIFASDGGDTAAWRDSQPFYEVLDAETNGEYKL
jgi:ribulose-5-phosphate 4-epimerase/fuculose-1-phosphate aldolase